MNMAEMRRLVISVYPGGDWARKVNNMPDHQVAAVYQRMLAAGKFNKEKN